MKKIVKVKEVLSSDIRSRCNAEAIRNEVVNAGCVEICIDLDGVIFMSRSFTDELLNIVENSNGKSVKIINAEGDAKSMIDVVSASRKKKRVLTDEESHITELKDMSSLEKFFATI